MTKKKKKSKEKELPLMRLPVKLIKVGNSQGFIIPKSALVLMGAEGEKKFVLKVTMKSLIIKTATKYIKDPRKDWEEKFSKE